MQLQKQIANLWFNLSAVLIAAIKTASEKDTKTPFSVPIYS